MQKDRGAPAEARTRETTSQTSTVEHWPQPGTESLFPTQSMDKGKDQKDLYHSTPGLLTLDSGASLHLLKI